MPCKMWPATCTWWCLIKTLAKRTGYLKTPWHGRELRQGSHSVETHWTNHHRAAGCVLSYNDPPLQYRCLNIQIYWLEHNAFQETLSCLTSTQVHFLGQRTRVISILGPKKKKRYKEKSVTLTIIFKRQKHLYHPLKWSEGRNKEHSVAFFITPPQTSNSCCLCHSYSSSLIPTYKNKTPLQDIY